MNITPLMTFLKVKPVMWTLAGLSIACIEFPIIYATLPLVFSELRPKEGSNQDVREMKEIGLLSVQRLQFSNVMTGKFPKDAPNLEKTTVYVRRIMRGHVTSTLDLSRIDVTNGPNGESVIVFPSLDSRPFIDEWIYFDSKGTGKYDTSNMTQAMDNEFRQTMLATATEPGRVERAKKQAEKIVAMLCPDREYLFRWPDDQAKDTPPIHSLVSHHE